MTVYPEGGSGEALPDPEIFSRLSRRRQRRSLQACLGSYLARLKREGRRPDRPEVLHFQLAVDAIGEGAYEQAYEDVTALRRMSAAASRALDMAGQRAERRKAPRGRPYGLRGLFGRGQSYS